MAKVPPVTFIKTTPPYLTRVVLFRLGSTHFQARASSTRIIVVISKALGLKRTKYRWHCPSLIFYRWPTTPVGYTSEFEIRTLQIVLNICGTNDVQQVVLSRGQIACSTQAGNLSRFHLFINISLLRYIKRTVCLLAAAPAFTPGCGHLVFKSFLFGKSFMHM